MTMLRVAFVALYFAGAVAFSSPASPETELEFRVLLDDREIGYHRYRLTQEEGDVRVVESEAEFDVSFLFFTAYRYRHSLSARWDGNCLESLSSRTNANGSKSTVLAQREDDQFVVETGDRVDELPACVMNFAYWDRRILDQSRLLNPQTGEYLEVDVEMIGQAPVEVLGRQVPANAYRMTAKDLQIDIWYSRDEGRWLALESVAKGGRSIRYELT